MDTSWFKMLIKDEKSRGVKPENHSFYLRQDTPAFTATLVVHGYSANPNDGRTVATAIFDKGHSDVVAICLPGHGAEPNDLTPITYQQWLDSVANAYLHLREHYQQIVIYAISMGALLAINASIKTPPAGLICMGTMLVAVDWRLRVGAHFGGLIAFSMRHILRRPYVKQSVLPGREAIVYDRLPIESAVELCKLMVLTRSRLSKLECPTLIIHSTTDQIAAPKGAQLLYDNIGSKNKAIIWGKGDHTFLTESTQENQPTIEAIANFCTSPMGYFADNK